LKTWVDAVVASAPMTSLVSGLGLAGLGLAGERPAVSAGGAVVCAAGLYVERLQARSLRRRRRAERLRSRHEVTELRRTIAQLREDVDAFQRALLDTEAVLAARSLPLLPPVPAPAVRAALPAVTPAWTTPAATPVRDPRETAETHDDVVVVPLADVEASEWVQTRERRPLARPSLPAQQPSPFPPSVPEPAALARIEDELVRATADAHPQDDDDLVAVAVPEHGRHVA
jgi:hypothetical protein